VGVIKAGRDAKAITIDDVALVSKAPGGKVTIVNDRKSDPGAVRGGVFGGTAGLVMATILGPLALGTVAAGAAVGAVAAAVKDSGLKNDDIAEVSKLMADGRSGLMIAMPLDVAEAWDAFVPLHPRVPQLGPAARRRHRPWPNLRAGPGGVPAGRGGLIVRRPRSSGSHPRRARCRGPPSPSRSSPGPRMPGFPSHGRSKGRIRLAQGS
jgi:hypothetical protein